jgi:nucleoid-associated protein YgaU
MKMTSDAKIGLLLGLIFIFIIAFILNGLPGLHGKGGSNQASAEDLSNLSSTASDNAALTQPAGVASPMGAPAASGDEVRFKTSLGTSGKAADSAPVAAVDTKTDALCAADSNTACPKSAQDVKGNVVDISSPAPKADAQVAVASGTTSDIVSTADAPKATDYTIASGDSPAKIAIKAYGPKDGVKQANITKIMAANNIKDPTKLVVGKKLTIPALPTGPEKLAVTNPDSFSKVEKLSTTTATKTEVKTSPDAKTVTTKSVAPKVDTKADVKTNPDTKTASKGTSEYTVVGGDNLWKIAAKTLGDRNRYNEILKLNTGKLGKDGSKLSVGMKLQIPAK